MKYFFQKFLFFVGLLFFVFSANAETYLPVDEVFSDITKDYKYYHEVQELYDRGILFPDANGKLNPNKLLTRDEFVGISMEVICRKCIQPNVEQEFLQAYTGKKVYYDINEKNPYFYCVAEADAKNYVRGYDKGYVCENNVSRVNEKPFCPDNKITREEAYAVILRNTQIWTIEQNALMTQDIKDGKVTEPLTSDVYPKNSDGSPYTFYGYFKKALSYQLVEYDTSGNQKIYKLLEPRENKIYPKQYITKEEFVYMAYIVLMGNSCKDTAVKNDIALSMKIQDKSCKEADKNCKISDLKDPANTYDFRPLVETTCTGGVDNPSGYTRRFINMNTGEKFYQYGRYIDNQKLPSDGVWRVYLRVVDTCGGTAEVYSTILVNNTKSLNVTILANPIMGYAPLLVSYEGVVTGGTPPYSYSWGFGDGGTGIGKYIDYVFQNEGVYQTKLVGADSQGRHGEATVIIKVLPRDCSRDMDGDGVNDCDDKCPYVKGPPINNGCPIYEPRCSASCGCDSGYSCDTTDPKICPIHGICKPIVDTRACLYDANKDIVYGNVTCNSCPCDKFVDFISTLRKCDLVFPAITSPNSREIYSKGGVFQVNK